MVESGSDLHISVMQKRKLCVNDKSKVQSAVFVFFRLALFWNFADSFFNKDYEKK